MSNHIDLDWDEKKRRELLERRRLDILHAALIFEGEVVSRLDDREDYGEVRVISTGMVDGECFVVVHTERNGVLRLITAWKGGRDERRRYQASIARRHQENEGER